MWPGDQAPELLDDDTDGILTHNLRLKIDALTIELTISFFAEVDGLEPPSTPTPGPLYLASFAIKLNFQFAGPMGFEPTTSPVIFHLVSDHRGAF